ncbi:MAG: three-Cys-motif partner protein TcmP [Planctomycetota bacterium]
MTLPDNDIRKWEYREHTRVKHILLQQYLKAWIPILGRYNSTICYFDGFAGRGEYLDDKGVLIAEGSPIIALKEADAFSDSFKKFLCFIIEKDSDNFQNLTAVLDREKTNIKNWDKIEVVKENNEFAFVIDSVFKSLEQKQSTLVPSFFFIDPFGYSGVPFKVIQKILSNPKTEVFFTLMTRDINRFLEVGHAEQHLDELYGTKEWKNLQSSPKPEVALVDLYRKQLHNSAKVKYSLAFRVCMPEITQTVYYLIHVTNNFKGHNIMKSIMYNQSADGKFAYLGPNDLTEKSQVKLFNVNNISDLKQCLLERFKGKTIEFAKIHEITCEPWYTEPPFIDTHYKDAIEELEKEKKVVITGRGPRGGLNTSRIAFLT